jgi:ribonuclease HII
MQNIDQRYFKQGYRTIAGVDEVGRGAWAGPLVAAAVILPPQQIVGLTDSKQLTPKQRSYYFDVIMQQALDWSVVSITAQEIDTIGLHRANLFALSYVLTHLTHTPDLALIDGFKIHHAIPVQAIVHGDAQSQVIAAASVIAKVTRDRLMCLLDYYDQARYCFASHKGYGTKLHQERLAIHGVSPWHRRSFAPIKQLLYN